MGMAIVHRWQLCLYGHRPDEQYLILEQHWPDAGRQTEAGYRSSGTGNLIMSLLDIRYDRFVHSGFYLDRSTG